MKRILTDPVPGSSDGPTAQERPLHHSNSMTSEVCGAGGMQCGMWQEGSH